MLKSSADLDQSTKDKKPWEHHLHMNCSTKKLSQLKLLKLRILKIVSSFPSTKYLTLQQSNKKFTTMQPHPLSKASLKASMEQYLPMARQPRVKLTQWKEMWANC